MRDRPRSLLICLLVSACACGDTSVVPFVEIGTGISEFEPLSEGQAVELHPGLQVGYHLFISLRATGVGPTDVEILTETGVVGSDRVQRLFRRYDLDRVGGGLYELVGLQLVLNQPECVRDQPTRVRVVVTDVSGQTAEAVRTLLPVAGADGGPDPSECQP